MRGRLSLETRKEIPAALLARLFIVPGIALFAIGCATEPVDQQATVNGVTAVEEECRSETVMGSDFIRQTCRTPAEWAIIDGKERPGAGEPGRQTP